MKAGASDYLTKPFHNPDELRHVIRRVLREAEAERTISLLSEELGRQFPPLEMIFLGEKMQNIYRMVQEVAPTSATVLISGPSGTGKELVARVVHQISPRREKAFVAVHCAALAEALLESELFGHERGAFTGAIAARKGRFEMADGGTMFLDEIGELPPAVQVKLLLQQAYSVARDTDHALDERLLEIHGIAKNDDVDTATEIIYRAGEITSNRLEETELAGADVIIRPQVGDLHWADFTRSGDLVKNGENACRESLKDIKESLRKDDASFSGRGKIARFFARLFSGGKKEYIFH